AVPVRVLPRGLHAAEVRRLFVPAGGPGHRAHDGRVLDALHPRLCRLLRRQERKAGLTGHPRRIPTAPIRLQEAAGPAGNLRQGAFDVRSPSILPNHQTNSRIILRVRSLLNKGPSCSEEETSPVLRRRSFEFIHFKMQKIHEF
ncbi:unnamed protein product, partial [Darwinula stevensoni]